MRWVLACMVALGGVASARVIRIPPVASACSEERTWDDVAACAATFGTVKIQRTLPHARLIRITNANAGDRGIYRFVESHKAWRLGGMYEAPALVLGLDTVSIGTRRVYRIEIGATDHADVALDDTTTAHAVTVRHEQMYCGGVGYRSSTVMTSCDVLIAGKTRWTFRGKVRWKDGSLRIAGDRSRAGEECEQAEVVPLLLQDDPD
jgi:hypothetical protein